jgi:hypothetical protein
MENDALMRCTSCYSEFTFEELENTKECPECGTTVPPHAIDHDVLLYINWQELRALTIPAMQWYEENKDEVEVDIFLALEAIIDRINDARPEGAEALTMDAPERLLLEEYEEKSIETLKPIRKTLAEYQDLFNNTRRKSSGSPN